ncbi:hypothetical protein STEG23_022581, partial [Scotinomys teguina]
MAMLAWKFPRTRLPVGASALCVVVLCWLYVFPVYRLPNEKEIVQGVLAQRMAWRRNQTAARLFSHITLSKLGHLSEIYKFARTTDMSEGYFKQTGMYNPLSTAEIPNSRCRDDKAMVQPYNGILLSCTQSDVLSFVPRWVELEDVVFA